MSKQQLLSFNTDRVKTIHFIGIGGVGMNGIAEVLLHEGYNITGSDLRINAAAKRLQNLGATIVAGHHPDNVINAEVVVVSSAIPESNPELQAAREARIPIVARAQMLAELMRFRYGIAIAGTHGKTTTTSLISTVLTDAKLDPSYVIGGVLNSSGANAYLGKNEVLVAEADESDASFLHLNPMMAVVTNIDADHMETYQNSFEILCTTFINFLQRMPFYGLAVMCSDDDTVKKLIPDIGRPIVTYGFDPGADIVASDYTQSGISSTFRCKVPSRKIDTLITLNMPGKHNVQNALAAIAVALELEVDINSIAQSLSRFSGIGRRFTILGDLKIDDKLVTLVDDYGHHPREIAATISAARQAWPERRITMLFQPHRYTRTRDLFDDFSRELSTLDALFMLPVYQAGEEEIPGVNSSALCRSVRQRSKLDPVLVEENELSKVLTNVLQNNDILIAQGAGSVSQIVHGLVKEFMDA